MQGTTEHAWTSGLTAAAERNVAIEVSPVAAEGQDAARRVYRCRVLSVEPGGAFVLERSNEHGAAEALHGGAEVDVVVLVQNQRWEGRCRIVRPFDFSLNADTRVRALHVTPPASVRSGQRRQFFRVTVARGEAGVTLHAVLPREPGRERLGPVRVDGTLVNIAGGGLGVSVLRTRDMLDVLERTRDFRCSIHLRQPPATLELDALLIHVEPLANQHVYLGFAFRFADAGQRRHAQDAIVRFATEVQRQQIRRQRGA